MKNRLIDLLYEGEEKCEYTDCGQCDYLGCESCGFHIIADHLIANGVRLEEKQATSDESKWIPVKDRLPEVAKTHNTRWDKSTDSIRVLCACVQADGKKMVKEGYCKVYSGGYVHWKIPGTIHSVTHWMPLPELPKGEQQ